MNTLEIPDLFMIIGYAMFSVGIGFSLWKSTNEISHGFIIGGLVFTCIIELKYGEIILEILKNI